MNILLTNDDSIHAPGIKILAAHLSKNHAVTVVAPKSEMSGVSHSCTIFSPLFIEESGIIPGVKAFTTNGTPADCVKLGVTRILKTPPDLILSGFNNGDNAGICAIYSGTVAGAREGVFFRIRSLSLSLCLADDAHYRFALQWLDNFIAKTASGAISFNPSRTYLNVNFPACDADSILGTKITRQGISPFQDQYTERTNPSGRTYYWLQGGKPASACVQDDENALAGGFVAVTPLTIDSTDTVFFEQYSKTDNLF